MKTLKKVLLVMLVLGLCVGCDQASKVVARNHLALSPPIYVMGDILRLHYTENTGAFLGLGASLSESVRFWSFVVFVSGVLVGFLGFLLFSQALNPLGWWGGTLVVGGGLSNLIDRILNNGAVIDFMNVGIGNLRTGVFNVADVAIMVGMGILLVSTLSLNPKKENV